MKTIFSALFCSLLYVSVCQAQLTGGMHLNYYRCVQGASDEHVDAIGMSFMAGYTIPETRIMVGADFGAACYAMKSYESDLGMIGSPELLGSISEEYGILNYSAFSRINLFESAGFNPYLEGRLGGITHYYTLEITPEEECPDGEEIDYSLLCQTDILGTIFTSGLGAGVVADLNKIRDGGAPVMIDLAVIHTNCQTLSFDEMSDEINPEIRSTGEKVQGNAANLSFRLGALFVFN